jgi:hypothetical protein
MPYYPPMGEPPVYVSVCTLDYVLGKELRDGTWIRFWLTRCNVLGEAIALCIQPGYFYIERPKPDMSFESISAPEYYNSVPDEAVFPKGRRVWPVRQRNRGIYE